LREVEQIKAEAASTKSEHLILVSEREHVFSDPGKPDKFRLVLTGDSTLTGTAMLEIIRHDGTVIYQDTFATNYLIDYGITNSPTPQQMEAYITKRATAFFEDDNFMQPALPGDRTFDANYSDKKIWEAVKRDTTAIGFYYKLGKEDGRYLAYSKEKGKVVLYFNCC